MLNKVQHRNILKIYLFTFLEITILKEALLYDTLKSHNLENKATKYIGLENVIKRAS